MTVPVPEDETFERATEHPSQEVFAPRLLPGPKRAEDIYRSEALQITRSLTGSAGVFRMWSNQFASTASVLPSEVVRDPSWAEFFIEAGITARYSVTPGTSVYGGVSYLESSTRGHDYTTNDNIYHGLSELAYAGVTFRSGDSGPTFDLSYGQQEFTVGNGMLVWAGASNGTQRGADYLGPRVAWANAALAKLSFRDLAVQAFWLKPNDAQAVDTGTRIAGLNADWAPSGPLRLGAMYVRVPQSNIVTRDGLDVFDVRVRWHPLWASPQFWLQGEYAYERNANVRAYGWYAQASYNGQNLAWKPLLAVQWSSLSGDKPGSSRWEGFDPLYFGNGNPNWYQGKILSTLFNNTNINTASLTLTLTPSDMQIVELWYLNFSAAVANSPLDIPAAGQPIPIGGGVPSKPLANEIDASWTYKFNKNVNVNVIAAYAAPGRGYKDLYASQGAGASGWWLVGTMLNVSY